MTSARRWRDLRFYARNAAEDLRRELPLALLPRSRRAFRERLAAASSSPAALFAFAEQEFGLYQREPELMALVDLLRSREPVTACEIGTWRGGTNFLLGQLLPSLRLLIGVDRLVQNRLRLLCATRAGLRRRLVRGSSRSAHVRRRVRDVLGSRRLDLLLIDGDHRYASALQDFLDYRELVADGGLVALHDIVPDHRSRFGRPDGPWSGGVPLLWRALEGCGRRWELVEDPEQNAFGIGVIEHRTGSPARLDRAPADG